jgi:hypothetical protein
MPEQKTRLQGATISPDANTPILDEKRLGAIRRIANWIQRNAYDAKIRQACEMIIYMCEVKDDEPV